MRRLMQALENKKTGYWLEKLFTQKEEKSVIKPSTEEIGLADAEKSRAKKIELDKYTVANMVKNSNQILISISSVFPWDLFPSTINVEATRVTVIHRQFLASQVHSVDIKDISNVFIDTGFLFATVIIVSRTFGQNDVKVIRLRKNEAIFIRRIIEGLRMFAKENIDTTNYSQEELISKLKELSTTRIVM